MKDSETDGGKVNPLNHAVSMKYKPASHKMRKLSSPVFLLLLNCMSRADTKRKGLVRISEVLYFQLNYFLKFNFLTHLGRPVLLKNMAIVHFYISLE